MAARSYLFVPADRPERFGKALASGADVVVVDLEDAVAPGNKDAAQQALGTWLASTPERVAIRINGVDSPWFHSDLALCALAGVAAVMVPKAERVRDLQTVAEASPTKPLLALIETAAGFDAMRELAHAPGVERLVFGSIDFQLDLGITSDDEALLYFRSHIVLVSRLAKLSAPVDGVSTAISDLQALQGDTARARRLGFGAKLCIHPSQVDTVNRGFSPSEAEVAWAHRVVDAAQAAGGAAVALDGRMIDRPVILRAQAVLQAWGTATL
jgi:citrate lyase subunit beta/citryl-CoA lyase